MTADPAPAPTRPVDSAPAPRWAFLAWVGFTVLLLYTIVVGGSWLGMYLGTVRLLDLALATAVLVGWGLIAARRPEWRPTTVIWPAFAAALGAIGLSMMGSDYPRLGLEILSVAVLLTALYLLLVRIMALPYARARIGGLMAALALVLSLAYIGWTVILWVEWWGLVGEIRLPPFRPAQLGLTWGSPSVLAVVIVLVVAGAIGGLGSRTRGARITVVLFVTLTAIVVLISGSRSVWLALAGTLVIMGLLVVANGVSRARLRAMARGRRVGLAAALVGVVTLAVVIVLGPSIFDRFLTSGDGGRPTYWATAMRMFEDAPVAGQGPGTWMVRRIAYTDPGELDLYQPHAHGQIVQTAAELGIVGLAAGIVGLACLAWLVLHAIRGSDPVRRRYAWTVAFGVVFLALDTVVDVHTIPTVALLLAIPIAVLDATSTRGIPLPVAVERVGRAIQPLAVAVLVLACAAAIIFLARAESAALTHQRAVAAAEGDWEAALAPALDAVTADPEIGAYQLTAALAAAAAGDWPTAEAAFRSVTRLDGLPAAWLGLAAAQVEQGAPADEVATSLAQALRLGAQQPALTLAAGQLYDRIGATEDAADAYVMTLASEPSLAADPAWRDALGAERFAEVVDLAIEAAPGAAWEIALMADEVALARDLAADSAEALRFIDAWQGDPVAVAGIQAAADAEPEDAGRLAHAARISARAGDIDAAIRYGRLLRLGPHYGPSIANMGYGLRDPERDAATGTSTYFYGTYTYRRPLTIDPIVPGLPGLILPADVSEAADSQGG